MVQHKLLEHLQEWSRQFQRQPPHVWVLFVTSLGLGVTLMISRASPLLEHLLWWTFYQIESLSSTSILLGCFILTLIMFYNQRSNRIYMEESLDFGEWEGTCKRTAWGATEIPSFADAKTKKIRIRRIREIEDIILNRQNCPSEADSRGRTESAGRFQITPPAASKASPAVPPRSQSRTSEHEIQKSIPASTLSKDAGELVKPIRRPQTKTKDDCQDGSVSSGDISCTPCLEAEFRGIEIYFRVQNPQYLTRSQETEIKSELIESVHDMDLIQTLNSDPGQDGCCQIVSKENGIFANGMPKRQVRKTPIRDKEASSGPCSQASTANSQPYFGWGLVLALMGTLVLFIILLDRVEKLGWSR